MATTENTDGTEGPGVGRLHEGERIAQCPVTGDWYCVTAWREGPDGQIRAVSKEQIDASEVPDSVE